MMATGIGLPTPLFQTRSRPPKRPLTKEEDDVILFAFETLDAEHRGFVTPKQLKVCMCKPSSKDSLDGAGELRVPSAAAGIVCAQVALRALGFGVKKADVVELLRKHGEEDSDKLAFHTFRELVADKLQERTVQDEYRRAFSLFDNMGMGAIDFPSLKKVRRSASCGLGMHATKRGMGVGLARRRMCGAEWHRTHAGWLDAAACMPHLSVHAWRLFWLRLLDSAQAGLLQSPPARWHREAAHWQRLLRPGHAGAVSPAQRVDARETLPANANARAVHW